MNRFWLLVSALAAASAATGCGGGNCVASENQLEGSVGELFDIQVDNVCVRKLPPPEESVSVEFYHGNDTVAKVLADVRAFEPGVTIPLSDGAVRRITSPDTNYPTDISNGTITFDTPLSIGSEVSGCFGCRFHMPDGSERTLNGAFRTTLKENTCR